MGPILLRRIKKPRRRWTRERRKRRRGCEKKLCNSTREFGFWAIAVGHLYEVSPDWHQHDRARPTVRCYQIALCEAVRDREDLRGCKVCCRDCGIEFLTVRANAGRRDLRCPFGCRDHHRCQQSNLRSVAYYRTEAGRQKKQRLNARRNGKVRADAKAVGNPVVVKPMAATTNHVELPSLAIQLPGSIRVTETMLEQTVIMPYLRLLFALIGRQLLTPEELIQRLRQRMRQHSLVHGTRRDYVVNILQQRPP